MFPYMDIKYAIEHFNHKVFWGFSEVTYEDAVCVIKGP